MTSSEQDIIIINRDCEATLIPFGNSFILKKGDEVRITQALGGSYTVMARGSLFRIEGKDADAIGKEVMTELNDDSEVIGSANESDIWDVLKTCYDPEIPVNMVDLGLIYSCEVNDAEDGGSFIDIKMTLTAPGCGMGPMLVDEVKSKVANVSGVRDVNVELVWDPPWTQDMISEAARLDLGMY
ncbi:MAG: putative Fe-S cluster assembly protein SufT [Candidatus Marinimicrobia bacterium]|nr:putative Fe-S cluster assembly protein SufT [Candidatus Neomarinimicrobiota bacterium]|tara:strand:+ start:33669 stop:34220 length:552 start_codon:yes stop_codon:yes gene_type:complete